MSARIALALVALLAGCATAAEPASPPPAPAEEAPAPKQEAAAPGTSAAPEATPAESPATEATPAEEKDKTVLFFLNPNGRPCQMQEMILNDMGHTLTDKANLQYVSVADPAMRPLLGDYGVRALPTLIVINKDGEELHRFTPGIHEAAEILTALE